MEIRCKRIISGKTYNTETATQLCGLETDEGAFETMSYLYQNRFGVFFHYFLVWGDGEHDREGIKPLTPEEAREWLEENCPQRTDLIETLFGEMPEAGTTEVKYTLRMPESLKDRITKKAQSNNQSLNAWIIRCLESCAAGVAAE